MAAEDLSTACTMDETLTNNKKRKKKKRSCYQCGQLDHRAKDCPNITSNASSYLQFAKRETPPDLGQFAASSSAATNTTTTNDGFSYIELFAGVGGFRLALDRLGGRCVFASEVDRFCIKNYQMNFNGDRPAGDINRIPSDSIPEHDLLVGGFPCQPFSSSGSKAGLADTEKGMLFREITRILKDKQPKGFLLENVRGLLLHDNGNTFTIIRTELEECGYTVFFELVDAVSLLPQERKRLYIIGIRNDLDCKYTFPSIPNLGRGVKDIIQQQSKEDVLSEEDIESLTLTPHQLNKVKAQTYTQKYPGSRFLCDVSLPSKTIESSYSSYMVGSQFIPVLPNNSSSNMSESKVSHEDEHIKWRRFSHREVARLQGFPETFHLCSQRAYHHLGNAVAPPVIAILAAPLVQTLGLAKNNNDKDWGWIIAKELLIEASPNDYRRIELKKNLV